MHKPRLLIFEGIMGSGKSTATRMFANRLAVAGLQVAAYTEAADPHPVRASDDLADFYRPWVHIGAADLAAHVRSKWGRYVDNRLGDDVFTVMDGQLFHGDMTNLFMMEMPPAELASHTCALMRVLAPLHPMVVNFRSGNLQKAIGTVFEVRGQDWASYQMNWKLASPYAVRRNLIGLEGFATMYEAYRAMTDSLFAELDCPKLAIDCDDGKWDAHYGQVVQALKKACVLD